MSNWDDGYGGGFRRVGFWESLVDDFASRNYARSRRAETRRWEADERVFYAQLAAEEARFRLEFRRFERAWELEERVLLQVYRREELMGRIVEQRVRRAAPPQAALPAAPQRALPQPQAAVLPEVTEEEIEEAATRFAFQLHGLPAAEERAALARISGELRRKFDPYVVSEVEQRIGRLLEYAR